MEQESFLFQHRQKVFFICTGYICFFFSPTLAGFWLLESDWASHHLCICLSKVSLLICSVALLVLCMCRREANTAESLMSQQIRGCLVLLKYKYYKLESTEIKWTEILVIIKLIVMICKSRRLRLSVLWSLWSQNLWSVSFLSVFFFFICSF